MKIRFDNSLVGVMIDRFGTDIIIKPDGADHSVTYVDVAVSNQFFGWIFSLGDKVEIRGHKDVVGQLRENARKFYEKYE